jgi:hypothetical protein
LIVADLEIVGAQKPVYGNDLVQYHKYEDAWLMIMRDWIRGLGGVLLGLGFMCLPVGFGANPKRDTSAFFRTADTGIWLKLGFILILSGIVVFLLAWIFPERR